MHGASNTQVELFYRAEYTRKSILNSAIELKGQKTGVDFYKTMAEKAKLEKRLDILLSYHLLHGCKEMISFQKRLVRYRGYLFTFL